MTRTTPGARAPCPLHAAGLVAGFALLGGWASHAAPGGLRPAELPAALAAARPGDVLTLADGTYRDTTLGLRGTGSADRPIVIRAATPGRVTFTGRSSIELRGAWVTLEGLKFEKCTVGPLTLRDTKGCRVTQCAVLDCNPPDDTRIHWIRVAGPRSEDNRIDHCWTDGKTKDGVVLVVDGDDGRMPQRTRIDHNRFTNVVRAVRNGMETLRVGTSAFGQLDSHTVVEDNYFYRCSGDAEIISSKSCANVYRSNTFEECEGAVTLRHGHRSVIEGNWFFGNGKPKTAGIRVHGTGHRVFNNYIERVEQFGIALPCGQSKFQPAGYEPTVDAVIAHNTLRQASLLIGSDRGTLRNTPPTALVLNNIVVGKNGSLVREETPGELRWAGNVFWAYGEARLGMAPREGILTSDPRLAPTGSALTEGSPALQAAVAVPFPIPHDIAGRPRGNRPHSGAEQLGPAPATRRPPSRRTTGPAWAD